MVVGIVGLKTGSPVLQKKSRTYGIYLSEIVTILSHRCGKEMVKMKKGAPRRCRLALTWFAPSLELAIPARFTRAVLDLPYVLTYPRPDPEVRASKCLLPQYVPHGQAMLGSSERLRTSGLNLRRGRSRTTGRG